MKGSDPALTCMEGLSRPDGWAADGVVDAGAAGLSEAQIPNPNRLANHYRNAVIRLFFLTSREA